MKETNTKKEAVHVIQAKQRPRSIGQWVAMGCLVGGVALSVIVVLVTYSSWQSFSLAKIWNTIRHPSEIKADVASVVTNTVKNTVKDGVGSVANTTLNTLKPDVSASQNGIGNKTITGIQVSGKGLLITAALIAPEKTDAKLELQNEQSGTLVASMAFGTTSGETSSHLARLFSVTPGKYTVKITTIGAWNVTLLEK